MGVKIINGIVSPVDNFEQHLASCQPWVEKFDSNVGIRLTLELNKKDNDKPDYVVYFIASAIVTTPKQPEDYVSQVVYTDSIADAVHTLLSIDYHRRRCGVHDWLRPVDANGREYPDGRVVCQNCGVDAEKVLPIVPGAALICMHGKPDIVSRFAWPDATYLQGGKGVVIRCSQGGGGYATFFVEAFPALEGYGKVFLRGEGEDIASAEQSCWDKFVAARDCPEHNWSRVVSGTYRKDGYACCTHCDLSVMALEPETLCVDCGVPTRLMLGNDYMCPEHQFSMDVDDYIARYQQRKRKGFFGEVCRDDSVYRRIEFPILQSIVKQRGNAGFLRNHALIRDELLKFRFRLTKLITGDELGEITSESLAVHPETIMLQQSFIFELGSRLD